MLFPVEGIVGPLLLEQSVYNIALLIVVKYLTET